MNNHKFIIRLKLNHVVFKLITRNIIYDNNFELTTYYLQYLRLYTNHVFHGYYK